METKVSIYVIVPGCYEKFNFMVPVSMTILSVQKLVCEILTDAKKVLDENGTYRLLNLATGCFLAEKTTVKDSGLSDGTELLLVRR